MTGKLKFSRKTVSFLICGPLWSVIAMGAAPPAMDLFAECKKIAHSRASDERKLKKLFDFLWEYGIRDSPEFATSIGRNEFNDRWTDNSLEAVERRKRELDAPLLVLKGIRREKLKPADQLNYDLFLHDNQENLEGRHFPSEFLFLNQMGGPQQAIPDNLDQMPKKTLVDYENILARLRKVPEMLDQNQALLERGLKQGVVPPKVTLKDVPRQFADLYEKGLSENVLYAPFTQIPATIPIDQRNRLEKEAVEVLDKLVFPRLKKFRAFLVEVYIPGSRNEIGWSSLPDGKAWYDYSLRTSSTTKMTADQIHELGLSEVRRIRGEMEKIKAETGFKGTFAEFHHFLRTESRFFYESREDLLKGYRDIAKQIDPQLMKLFGKLPRMTYGVKPVPEYSERSQSTAFYQAGSYEAARAGYFFANTYDLKSRAKWEMESLALHEAVPGHHLQISLALEQDKLPEFRRYGGYTAFIEGWGLYSEGLGYELGLYQDKYSKYGQLANEVWRAVRLVIDTGIHARHWSREQAVAYFRENTSKTEHDIGVEVDRYIVWAGQAVAYKIGELKFKQLRAEAEKALGSKFDIRKFHDAVLENGGLPLMVLETHMRRWISDQKRSVKIFIKE